MDCPIRTLRLVSVCVCLAACDSKPEADLPARTAVDTVRATLAATIGELDGDTEYMFGDIMSVAADDSGRIYVADRIGSTVRVYGPDGRHLAPIGGEGSGPGEFEWPADMTFDTAGRLYVRDGARVTVFENSRRGGVPDSVVATWLPPGYANLQPTRSRVDVAGRFLYPVDIGRDTMPHFYLPFERGAPTADTIAVPDYPTMSRTLPAYYRTSAGGGRMLPGFGAAPFSPIPVWDVTHEATVISGDGESYVLHETNAVGDTLRVIRGPGERRPVPSDELADSIRALDVRLDSIPVPLGEVVQLAPEIRDRRWPEHLPAYIGVHVGQDGRIWVEQWPGQGWSDERVYHVFDRAGEFLAVVLLPAPLVRDSPPFFTGSMVYGVVRDPDTDVEQVVSLRLPALRD